MHSYAIIQIVNAYNKTNMTDKTLCRRSFAPYPVRKPLHDLCYFSHPYIATAQPQVRSQISILLDHISLPLTIQMTQNYTWSSI